MQRRSRRSVLAVLASAAVAATTFLSAGTADAGSPATDAGPPYVFKTEIMTNDVVPLKNQAMLTRTTNGYLFRAGQQHSHIVIKRVRRGLRIHDSGTQELVKVARACRRIQVRVGVAAVCRVPDDISRARPLLIEVWPRLGDDYLDSHTLSARFAVTMLSDKGNDVAHFGAGPDFFNGFSGRDVVTGGRGNDWIRLGLDNDLATGGPGNDHILGQDGHDVIRTGPGDDRLGGNAGDDRLYGGLGADYVLCGDGIDSTEYDPADRTIFCENVIGN